MCQKRNTDLARTGKASKAATERRQAPSLDQQRPLVSAVLFLRPVPALAATLALGLRVGLSLGPSSRLCNRAKDEPGQLQQVGHAGVPVGAVAPVQLEGRALDRQPLGAQPEASLRQQAQRPLAGAQSHVPQRPPHSHRPSQATPCAYAKAIAAR